MCGQKRPSFSCLFPQTKSKERERESLSISRQLIPFRTEVFSARLRTLVSFWSAKFCWSMQSRTTWASRACGLMYSLEDSRKAKMYVLSGQYSAVGTKCCSRASRGPDTKLLSCYWPGKKKNKSVRTCSPSPTSWRMSLHLVTWNTKELSGSEPLSSTVSELLLLALPSTPMLPGDFGVLGVCGRDCGREI